MIRQNSDNGEAVCEMLPPALTTLADQVAQGTRLWPKEKQDVRAELVSHFWEALQDLEQQGLPFEARVDVVRDSFGDPELTARLIRRGKKRARPMMWRIATRVLMVLVIMTAATAAYAGWFIFGKPNPTVDYLARLNEPIEATPEQERAWPVLREVILHMEPMPDELREVRHALPDTDDPQWALALGWVESNRHLISEIRRAAERSIYGCVYNREEAIAFVSRLEAARGLSTPPEETRSPPEQVESADEAVPESSELQDEVIMPPTLELILPGLGDVRNIARFLVLDARDKGGQGDFRGAWGSLDLAYRLGRQVREAATLIEQLVGTAMVEVAVAEMRAQLFDFAAELTAEELAWLSETALLTAAGNDFVGRFDGEQLMFHDVFQHVFTDDGQGNGRLIPRQFDALGHFAGTPAQESGHLREAYLLSLATMHADRRETVAKYQELWAQLEALRKLPLYDANRERGTQRIIDELYSDSLMAQRYAVLRLLLPSLTRADQMMRETVMHEQATRTLVGLLVYQQQKARLPAMLQAFAEDVSVAVPQDVYSGRALRYRLDDTAGFILYSVGRNLQDDGGSAQPTEEDGESKTARDIVYWPADWQ